MALTQREKRNLKRKISKITREGDKLDKETAKSFFRILRDTRRRINTGILEAPELDVVWLTRIRDSVDEHIVSFRDRITGDLLDKESTSWLQGIRMVDEPLGTAGITLAIPSVSEELLRTLQFDSTDLITGLSDDMRSKVRTTLNRAVLGELKPEQAIKRINSELELIGNRGEKIVRTEVGRSFSIANQARQSQAQEILPQLKKQWQISEVARTRDGHREANGQIRDINKSFDIRNDRTGVIDKLMFPRDPTAPPEQVIKCRCTSLPYMEEWE